MPSKVTLNTTVSLMSNRPRSTGVAEVAFSGKTVGTPGAVVSITRVRAVEAPTLPARST